MPRDLWVLLQGRENYIKQQQYISRHNAAIISEVVNKTMGGNGVIQSVFKMWPLGQEDEDRPMTREEMKRILAAHKKMQTNG